MPRRPLALLLALIAVALLAIAPGAGAAPPSKAKTGGHERAAKKPSKGVPAALARWERRHGLRVAPSTARRDTDRDGLRNLGEFRAGTNPRDRDSDDDGVEDGDEHAGSITSFQDGVLEIALLDGTTLRARVDDGTEIHCPQALATRSVRHGGEDEDEDEDEDERESEDEREHEAPAPAPAPVPVPPSTTTPSEPAPAPAPAPEPGSSGHGSGHEEDDEDEARCGTDALVTGRVVEEAEVSVSRRGLVLEEIELR